VTFRRIFFTLLAAASFAAPSYAAVLANYGFTNVRTSTDVDLNSSASDFTNGTGIAASSSAYYTTSPSSVSNPSLATISDTTTSSQSGAVGANDYYTFTLTPNMGQKVSLTDLKIDITHYGSGASTVGVALYSSLDNFSTSIGSASSGTTSFVTQTISLAASQFQNFTSAVTFRIYVWDGQDNSGKGDLFDNVILDGTLAAVPEPSTWAMMGPRRGLARRRSALPAEASLKRV
jgi:hypothetical protein